MAAGMGRGMSQASSSPRTVKLRIMRICFIYCKEATSLWRFLYFTTETAEVQIPKTEIGKKTQPLEKSGFFDIASNHASNLSKFPFRFSFSVCFFFFFIFS